MNCFNINEEIVAVQDEQMDPEEEPHDIFKIVNMEWEQYVPGVTDAPKAEHSPELSVKRIMDMKSWKGFRQEIKSMEVDTVAIRKAEAKKLEEEKKAQDRKKSKAPAARKARGSYRTYSTQQIQELIDLTIFCGMSARKAVILTGIVIRTAQHYVRQYKLKEDPGWLPDMKMSHLGGNSRKLKEEHTQFLMDFF